LTNFGLVSQVKQAHAAFMRDIKTLWRGFERSHPNILMLNGSRERGIARVAGSASAVESRWVGFIQSGSELQSSWQIGVG
jgi:hypothetical protein